MKITRDFLRKKNACGSAVLAYKKFKSTDLKEILDEAMRLNRFDWANWLITRCFKTKKQKVIYAIFAAELVLKIFEDKYPKDDRPRKSIEAAKSYLKSPSAKTKKNAYAAYTDAYVAYTVAYAAYAAAYAAYAAYADADAAAYDDAAAYAADADADIKKKIIEYGLTLIKD